MDIESEQFKQLLETFSDELDERLQDINDGLLKLEKNSLNPADFNIVVEKIFREAHNIKGASRGIGITHIGEIAHQVESLFSDIQTKKIQLTHEIIDLCLEASDMMRLALKSYMHNSPLTFDMDNLILRLKQGGVKKTTQPIVNSNTSTNTNINDAKDVKLHESIRVSIESLDRVSALMEEIQINKIAIDDHYKELAKLSIVAKTLDQQWKQIQYVLRNNKMGEYFERMLQLFSDNLLESNNIFFRLKKEMHGRIGELDVLANALQNEVSVLRLIPAEVLLRTLPRVVRDLANELNKKIDFIMTGNTVKMDKMIIEQIHNPIIHLLRNAIDHGIETNEQRLNQNKSLEGHIRVDIREEGDRICISISDDGAGIDVKQIADNALKKNLISAQELSIMNEAQILDLIFVPGFSTKKIITDISGRGVGLDIVKANISDLKGQVKINTQLGKGTTIELHLPLTLSSERGMLFMCGGQHFVIPTNAIERVATVTANQIIEIEDTLAILIEGHPIPLRLLTDVLGLQNQETFKKDYMSIIVLKNSATSVALLVDNILNEREIVIKPLQPPINAVPCVIGGTLASAGDIIIVLNPNDIINQCINTKKVSPITFETNVESSTARPHILVVDDSITTRALEKNILENHHFVVTTAVNGQEAWDLLKKNQFSLIITDVTMPIMDGFTLTEQIKQSAEYRELPVIIVTSLGSESEKQRGISVGADAYIVKNEFESEKLLEIVEQLV